MKEPAGITVAPDASIWVADTGNNRIEQWNSSLSLVRVVGKEGSGGGEFKAPIAIEADLSGNIWVGDQKNNRVEEFGEGGKYFGQFGANGSGKFSFSTAAGIAIDATGNIWVADPGHTKVQKWTQEVPRSEITTTLWLDSNQQPGLHGTCKSASCTIEPQWTVESKNLSAGSHSAKVKTIDGLGRSTESTVSFQVTPDTTKPTLQAGGELVNAPEGWVEQETYGFNATATDGGAGVTSIAFKIDGQQVASASQACPDGGCSETLSKQISMAGYAGGAHSAEIVTTDGTGNTAKKQWTINVDPEGHISASEVTATLEALEGTTDANLVGLPETEEELEGTYPGAGTVKEGDEFEATGTAVPSTVQVDPAQGFTMSFAEGGLFGQSCTGLPPQSEEDAIQIETCVPGQQGGVGDGAATIPVTVTPLNVSPVAGQFSSVEANATLAQNTKQSVDTVIRPLYEGLLSFQQIRTVDASDEFSWQIDLQEGMYVKAASADAVEVFYENDHPAFTVTAVEAHDAVGTTVPTDLSVEPDGVLTLHVQHKSQPYVYPVIAGSGWQGGYISTELDGPMDEQETREAAEQAARELHERMEQEGLVYTEEYASEYINQATLLTAKVSVVSGPIASGSSSDNPRHWVEVSYCLYPGINIPEVEYPPPPEAEHREKTSDGRSVLGSCVDKDTDQELLAAIAVGGYFHWINGKKVWHNDNEYFNCTKVGKHQPAKVNCGIQPKESKTGITIRGDFRWPDDIYHPVGPTCETIYGHVNSSVPHKEVKEEIWDQLYKPSEKCDWPAWPK